MEGVAEVEGIAGVEGAADVEGETTVARVDDAKEITAACFFRSSWIFQALTPISLRLLFANGNFGIVNLKRKKKKNKINAYLPV